MKMPGELWSKDEIRIVRKMVRENAHYSEIGEKLGRSRGAVVAICCRLKIRKCHK